MPVLSRSRQVSPIALFVAAALSFGVLGCDALNGLADGSADSETDKSKKKKKKKSGKKKKKKEEADKDDEPEKESGPGPQELEDGIYAAPEPGDVPSVRVGAWAKYAIKGKPGVLHYRVTDQRNDLDFFIEADQEGGPMKVEAKAWMRVPDLREHGTMKLLELEGNVGGQPLKNFNVGTGSFAKSFMEKVLNASVPPKLTGLPQEDVTVPAGTFKGCYRWINKSKISVPFAGTIETTETIWTHPRLPLPAYTRLKTEEGTEYELIAFGFDAKRREKK